MQIRIRQFNRIEVMPLSDQQVFPAVVVVIEETHSPTGMGQRDWSEADRLARVREGAISAVLINGVALIREVCNHDIGPAIIIVVGEIYPHPSIGSAILINRNAAGKADFLERAVSPIVVKKFRHRIVRNKKI